jgi:hypothetical protein
MPVDFDADRWERVKENARMWWAGELGRPLIQVALVGRDPRRPEPAIPYRHFTAAYGPDVSADQVVDVWDHHLSCQEYLGDAFPTIWPNFGAGVMAAFLGARLEVRPDTVWFHPTADVGIADLRLSYDGGEYWLGRVKDVCRAAMRRWDGLVQVGMTDLGGNLDVLSTFRPGEKLLLDLCDHGQEVKRLTWEAHELWHRYFAEIDAVLQPSNPGYSAWAGFYSAEPHYMLQCDFCYMISPAMFDEFVRPELDATCRRLTNPFYHLDGPGQLPHLDSILAIDALKGVQWIPGAGQPDMDCWPEVYTKVRRAGKLVQIYGGPHVLDAVVQQTGSGQGIVLVGEYPAAQRDELVDLLRRYGALD